ncbi:Replicative DNA helicase [Prochlorococcus marinus str. MIT 9211]|uniref:Replicative DNA helicase n=1 Tax=Prochlorococcus marinus (strain MIT 9211) TaxID=93059 RepID=A9BCA4_PROM4|nr:Replicative DNA helicase [Prochlorococcus marinus str. MIT 9211]
MDQKQEKREKEETEQLKSSEQTSSTAEILTSVFDEIESRSNGTSVAGIPVNFYDFDAMTQGLQRGSLNVIAGRPAMGKTSLCLNIAKNVAQIHDLPVCLFGLEMSKECYTYRLLSMEVGIETGRLRTGRLQQDEWSILGKGIETIGKLPIFINDKAAITVEEIRATCERIKKEQGNGELGLVVIDYVQLMDGQRYMECRDAELGRIVSDLKNMATQLNVPLLLMSQLSRDIEHRENKRPMLCDLRETQSLESDADMVVMIYREEYYHPETCDRGITELITCKHRNGPLGTVKLLFEPQFTRFRNLAA